MFTLVDWLFLFLVMTAAFVMGQVLSLLILKPSVVKNMRRAKPIENVAAPLPSIQGPVPETRKRTPRGGNWFGGGTGDIRKRGEL